MPPTPTPPLLPRVVAGVMRWGEWGVDLDTLALRTLIEGCLAGGVTAFDHADIYGHYSEEARFGRVLAEAPSLRDRMTLVTKCGIRMLTERRPAHRLKSYDSGRAHIVASADASLRALRTDRLDVLLLHRPDLLLDADEAAEAFRELRDAGKVLHFGVSNFTPSQFALLHDRWPELATNQVELSLTHLDPLTDGTLDQAQRLRRPPMIWSPLGGGGGLLDTAGPHPTLAAKLAEVAARLGTQPDVLAYAFVLRHPSCPSVVTGSSRLERILRAQRAAELDLDRETWYELLEAARGHEVA